ncbi:MAG TPA: hypothetical protein VGB15_11710 [Longimicrobium sp.]
MAGKRPVVYWDANVYINWLLDKGTDAEREGIAFWHDLIVAREAVLMVSTIMPLEVTPHLVGPLAYERYEAFVDAFAVPRDPDPKVIREAARLREQSIGFRQKSTDDRVICVPDAIHLATANMQGCDQFHTFDKSGRHGCFGLLPYAGRFAGFNPKIGKPAVQESLRPKPARASTSENSPLTLFDAADAGEPERAAEAAGAEAGIAQGGLALGGSDGEGDSDATAAEGADEGGAEGAPASPAEADVAAEQGNGKTPEPSAAPLVLANADPAPAPAAAPVPPPAEPKPEPPAAGTT